MLTTDQEYLGWSLMAAQQDALQHVVGYHSQLVQGVWGTDKCSWAGLCRHELSDFVFEKTTMQATQAAST
jgi:hypothetical protein